LTARPGAIDGSKKTRRLLGSPARESLMLEELRNNGGGAVIWHKLPAAPARRIGGMASNSELVRASPEKNSGYVHN
jgi:hypothetical protein